MKKILFLFLCFYTSLTYSQPPKEVVDYVNPFIGTALKGEGGTVPYVGTPFAMTSFLPQTRENKMGGMAYVYDDEHIMGFLGSHQHHLDGRLRLCIGYAPSRRNGESSSGRQKDEFQSQR